MPLPPRNALGADIYNSFAQQCLEKFSVPSARHTLVMRPSRLPPHIRTSTQSLGATVKLPQLQSYRFQHRLLHRGTGKASAVCQNSARKETFSFTRAKRLYRLRSYRLAEATDTGGRGPRSSAARVGSLAHIPSCSLPGIRDWRMVPAGTLALSRKTLPKRVAARAVLHFGTMHQRHTMCTVVVASIPSQSP